MVVLLSACKDIIVVLDIFVCIGWVGISDHLYALRGLAAATIKSIKNINLIDVPIPETHKAKLPTRYSAIAL